MKSEVGRKLKIKEHIPDSLVIKKMRMMRNLTMREAGTIFNVSIATIKRKENKYYVLKLNERETFVNAYGFSNKEFIDLKLSREIDYSKSEKIEKIKVIQHNKLRRSYKKMEVLVRQWKNA